VKRVFLLALLQALLAIPTSLPAQTTTVDPNTIQFSPHRHRELPPALLARIKATTDLFEKIDGISYEQAVDLYKRDLDPEENLVLYEEMARAYKLFCQQRCTTRPEQLDVYRSLLLRTMWPAEEAMKRVKLQVLKPVEAAAVMRLYRLRAKPIEVIQGR
jgi:hypothetical protein